MPSQSTNLSSPILYYPTLTDRNSVIASRDKNQVIDQTTEERLSPNNISFIIPAFVENITIDISSGGGGGGGGNRPEGPGTYFSVAGGGGGGGSVVRKKVTKAIHPSFTSSISQFRSLNCTVGYGGAGVGFIDQGVQGQTSDCAHSSPSIGTLATVLGGFGGYSAYATTFTYEFGAGGSADTSYYLGDLISEGGLGAGGFIDKSGGGGGGAGIDTYGGIAIDNSPGLGGFGSPNGGNGGTGRTTTARGGNGSDSGGGGGGGLVLTGTGEATSGGGNGGSGYIKIYYDNNVNQTLFETLPSSSGQWPTEVFTWTIPEYVDSVLIECWGAGGTGGEGNDVGLQRGVGGGGAGGNYARTLLTNLLGSNPPGVLFLYVAGAAAYDSFPSPNGAEGSASFAIYNTIPPGEGLVVCRATGGRPGGRGSGGTGPGAVANTTSSAGVVCIGDVIFKGGDGGTGADFPNRSGAGGGAACAFGNGLSATSSPTFLPGGHQVQFAGRGGFTRDTSGVGLEGAPYGGGGGGGFSPTLGTSRAGGWGYAGAIQLTWVTNQQTSSNFLPFFNPT
jgi:hypothetical protein